VPQQLRVERDGNAIERGSVTRRDGHGVKRGNWSGSLAAAGGRPRAALPRTEGLSIKEIADRLGARWRRSRHPSTIRPARTHGQSSAGTSAWPRLRRLHPATQRHGRRVRLLQGLPSGRDPAGAGRASRAVAAMLDWCRRFGQLAASAGWLG
jgi:hypothetical protein